MRHNLCLHSIKRTMFIIVFSYNMVSSPNFCRIGMCKVILGLKKDKPTYQSRES